MTLGGLEKPSRSFRKQANTRRAQSARVVRRASAWTRKPKKLRERAARGRACALRALQAHTFARRARSMSYPPCGSKRPRDLGARLRQDGLIDRRREAPTDAVTCRRSPRRPPRAAARCAAATSCAPPAPRAASATAPSARSSTWSHLTRPSPPSRLPSRRPCKRGAAPTARRRGSLRPGAARGPRTRTSCPRACTRSSAGMLGWTWGSTSRRTTLSTRRRAPRRTRATRGSRLSATTARPSTRATPVALATRRRSACARAWPLIGAAPA